MSWRGEKGGIAAARMGHDVIMTPNSHLYIDHYQAKDKQTEPTAIGGFLPLERVYSYHPRPDSLTADQQQHVLGVQANLWTEYIGTNTKLEYMLFPRVLALSEIAWTPRSAQNYDEFSTKRLPARLQELEQMKYFYRIPEAKITFATNAAGRRTAEITPFVANSQVYYTLDGHKPDQTCNLYNGPVALAVPGAKPMTLNYIIVTPGGRVSNMFSVPLQEGK
jgi:hexosaminidase